MQHVDASRPLVLLDVDGVLNALARPSGAVWSDWRTGHADAGGHTWSIRWAPAVVEAVTGWLGVADVQWLTTWGHDANSSLRHLLEMPELPVAGTHDAPDQEPVRESQALVHAAVAPAAPDALSGRWWKFDVVRRLVAADPERPLVWLDDDLAVVSGVGDWMQQHVKCLLVVPDSASGLTPDDVDRVERFLRN